MTVQSAPGWTGSSTSWVGIRLAVKDWAHCRFRPWSDGEGLATTQLQSGLWSGSGLTRRSTGGPATVMVRSVIASPASSPDFTVGDRDRVYSPNAASSLTMHEHGTQHSALDGVAHSRASAVVQKQGIFGISQFQLGGDPKARPCCPAESSNCAVHDEVLGSGRTACRLEACVVCIAALWHPPRRPTRRAAVGAEARGGGVCDR